MPDDRYDRAKVLQWMFFEQYTHEPAIAVVRFLVAYSGDAESHAATIETEDGRGLPRARRDGGASRRQLVLRRRVGHTGRHRALRVHPRRTRRRLRPRAVSRRYGRGSTASPPSPGTFRSTHKTCVDLSAHARSSGAGRGARPEGTVRECGPGESGAATGVRRRRSPALPGGSRRRRGARVSVRVRFAPSPTGSLHLGNALMAVANRRFADEHGGALVLRIDDTDPTRVVQGGEEAILDDLHWLGVDVGRGPLRQSERAAVYEAAADAAETSGGATRDPDGSLRLGGVHAAPCRRNRDLPARDASRTTSTSASRTSSAARTTDRTRSCNAASRDAIGGELPEVMHHGLLLGEDGKKLSKRHGHASVVGPPRRRASRPPRFARTSTSSALPAHDVQPRPGSDRAARDRRDRGDARRRAHRSRRRAASSSRVRSAARGRSSRPARSPGRSLAPGAVDAAGRGATRRSSASSSCAAPPRRRSTRTGRERSCAS